MPAAAVWGGWAFAVAAAWVGWGVALAAAWTLRRRMERVADAEHELRGAATAIRLLAQGSPTLRLQLDRMEGALADLAEARGAEPPPAADLEAGRLAQVLGNVIANAAEHGLGAVEVRNRNRPARSGRGERERGLAIAKRAAREPGGRAGRLAIAKRAARRLGGRGGLAIAKRTARELRGRGRGLAIARRAARQLGGRLRVESEDGFTRAVIELPEREADDSAQEGGRRGA
jgi:signal transduction histidine kinase